MPHGSIISEADAWAAAAAEALSDGEEQSPRPPPYASDGLTVSFFPDTDKPRRERRRYETSDPLSGKGLKRPSKQHSGNFGRWGPEVREQWSCCLWDEKGNPRSSDDGEFGTNTNGGGSTGISSRRRGGTADGCEAVPHTPGPGGMTTADDVNLVWGGSRYNNTSSDSSENPKARHEAWGTGEGADDRELWKPLLASRIRGGDGGGAAWSLIRQRRRPQTANARMVSATVANSGNGKIPVEKGKTTAAFGGGSGGGSGGARHDSVSNSNFQRRLHHGSSRPGSAPLPGKRASRHPGHKHHDSVKRQSSLMSLRSARATAGWQRKRPVPIGSGNGKGFRTAPRTNRPASSGGSTAISGGAGGSVPGGVWQSRSPLSLNGGGSTYSVYSKGGGRVAAVTPVGDATMRRRGKENGGFRRPL